MTRISICFILSILILSSCTIEKRKYSSGYHTTWNVQHLFPKGNSANQFQREESKLSLSPKLISQNDNALRPISSDSIQKQESGKQAESSIDSKHKKQRQTISISDTVPETKKNESKMQNTVELFDQLQQDRRSIRFSWLSLLASLVVFIGGFAIWWQTESALSEALLSLGFIGLIASLILIITFTILKNKHKKENSAPSISDTVPETIKKESTIQNTVEPFDQLEFDKKQVAHSWLGLLISVVTFIGSIALLLGTDSEIGFFLLPLGILGGIVSIILIITFTILKHKHENLINLDKKRHENESKPAVSEEEKNLLQLRFDKLTRKLRINKILITISAIAVLMLTLFLIYSGYSSAAVGALEIFILLLLLFISIRIVQRNKKAKIEDRLHATR